MLIMKFSFVSAILAILLITGCTNKSGQPEWQKKYNDPEEVRTMFVNPPMFYAPHAFWFWDDTIKDEHFAASMIDEMARQGLNPGYAHPRGRLRLYQPGPYPVLPKEQYLEQPWFNSLGNAVQKAKDHGLTLGYCGRIQLAQRTSCRKVVGAASRNWKQNFWNGNVMKYRGIQPFITIRLILP